MEGGDNDPARLSVLAGTSAGSSATLSVSVEGRPVSCVVSLLFCVSSDVNGGGSLSLGMTLLR